MASLPEELVVEIMSWLPPESLVQSKCVSKYWYFLITSLINDPTFVSKHLRNLNDKNNIFSSPSIALTCLRIFRDPVYHYKELFSLLSLSNKDEKISSVSEFLDLPTIPDEKDMSCVTASHCDGVICLADYYHNIILSNPALNRSRVVPKPSLIDRFVLQGVGFGHDSKGNDYKVVRFGRDMSLYPRAEVYSLRSDSWKEIQIDPGTQYFPTLHVELYFKGCFYWLMSGPNYMVRCFDMSDEVFRNVLLPDSVQVAKAHWTGLGILNESVALFLSVRENVAVSTSIEVWTTNDRDGGVKGSCSWIKKSTIGPFEGIDCPLAFWNSEELLMRGSNFKDIVSYNIRTREVRDVNVDGLDGVGCRAFSYVKSLVSV